MTVKPGIAYHPTPAGHPAIAAVLAGYARLAGLLRQHSMAALRIALGVVYVWFGALKLTSAPPVAQLVRDSIPFVAAPGWLVPALGVFELVIGLCLIAKVVPMIVLPLFVAHLIGTFSVLVVQPGVAFEHDDPLLLSMTGEFVVKNLVLLAAGIAVCTSAHRDRTRQSPIDSGLATDLLATDMLARDMLAADLPATEALATDLLATDLLAKDLLAKEALATDVLATDLLGAD